MLSSGEFSHICKVSTKTLRYYAEIGLIQPYVVDPKTGYRYYSIEQLETMLLINRLKSYTFSLEEIKALLESGESYEDKLYSELNRKKQQIGKQVQEFEKTLDQLHNDISNLEQGKSIMSYLQSIDVQLVDMPMMNLLFIRKKVHQHDFVSEYGNCFHKLIRKITEDKLTSTAPPMVLFHSAEFGECGLDTEFAIPVKDYVTGTRNFHPKLCLKTVLHGSYAELPSVYTKQRKWMETQGYEFSDALYEVYVTDPSQVADEREIITEVYSPVKKKSDDLDH